METPAKSPPTPPAIALGREGGKEGHREEGAAGAAAAAPRGLRGGNAAGTADPRAGQNLPQGQGPSSGRAWEDRRSRGRGGGLVPCWILATRARSGQLSDRTRAKE